jgi:hypothetical protein
MLEHCSDPSTQHALHDLEGLYHVTMDDQPYPPYFDVEWTSTEEEAYPWKQHKNKRSAQAAALPAVNAAIRKRRHK